MNNYLEDFVNKDQMHALLYEALETEKGGVQIYNTALRCRAEISQCNIIRID